MLFVLALRAYGLGTMALSPLLNAVVYVLLIGQQRNIARMVTRYDERRDTSTPSGSE